MLIQSEFPLQPEFSQFRSNSINCLVRIRSDDLSDIKEDLAFLESPMREPDKVGRRGLYEHERNKNVWHLIVKASVAEER